MCFLEWKYRGYVMWEKCKNWLPDFWVSYRHNINNPRVPIIKKSLEMNETQLNKNFENGSNENKRKITDSTWQKNPKLMKVIERTVLNIILIDLISFSESPYFV